MPVSESSVGTAAAVLRALPLSRLGPTVAVTSYPEQLFAGLFDLGLHPDVRALFSRCGYPHVSVWRRHVPNNGPCISVLSGFSTPGSLMKRRLPGEIISSSYRDAAAQALADALHEVFLGEMDDYSEVSGLGCVFQMSRGEALETLFDGVCADVSRANPRLHSGRHLAGSLLDNGSWLAREFRQEAS